MVAYLICFCSAYGIIVSFYSYRKDQHDFRNAHGIWIWIFCVVHVLTKYNNFQIKYTHTQRINSLIGNMIVATTHSHMKAIVFVKIFHFICIKPIPCSLAFFFWIMRKTSFSSLFILVEILLYVWTNVWHSIRFKSSFIWKLILISTQLKILRNLRALPFK